jgi:hypothetical protein
VVLGFGIHLPSEVGYVPLNEKSELHRSPLALSARSSLHVERYLTSVSQIHR